MKRLVLTALVAMTAGLVHAQPAAGQGGVIDWIHRLSGPSMLGASLSYFRDFDEFRVRLTGSGRWAVGFKEHTIRAGHTVNMFALQPTIERNLGGPVEVGAGFAFNRLGGEGHDEVWHITVPFYGQIRHPVATDWFLRIGLGGHIFPSFEEGDFLGPEESRPGVTVKTDGAEVAFGLILGFDYTGTWRSP